MNYWEKRYFECSKTCQIDKWWYANEKDATQNAIRSFMADYKPESVLDFGCGIGNNVDLFDCQYVGYDIVDEMIEDNIVKYHDKYFTSSLSDALARVYDLVMFVGVIQHIPDGELTKTIDAVKTRCKDILILEISQESNEYIFHRPDLAAQLVSENKLKLHKSYMSDIRLLWMKP